MDLQGPGADHRGIDATHWSTSDLLWVSVFQNPEGDRRGPQETGVTRPQMVTADEDGVGGGKVSQGLGCHGGSLPAHGAVRPESD